MIRRKIQWIIFLAVMLSMTVWMALTSKAENYTQYIPAKTDDKSALFEKQVTFNDRQWYIIEDNSESNQTVTLFAVSPIYKCYYNDTDHNIYDGSLIKKYLDGVTSDSTGSFYSVRDVIKSVDLDNNVKDVKLYLLDLGQVQALPVNIRVCGADWWIRHDMYAPDTWQMYVMASYNSDDPYASETQYGTGISAAVLKNTKGVRPALKLDLTQTVFSADSKEFVKKVAANGVTLNKRTLTLTTGNTTKLSAIVSPSGATNKNVTWSSDKESIASVDTNGTITAVSAGSATITVTTEDGSHTASCTVTVTDKLTLKYSSINAKVGNVRMLSANIMTSTSSDKKLRWSVNGTSIKLYQDESCSNPIVNNTPYYLKTIFIECVNVGYSTITVTRDSDESQTASCSVMVKNDLSKLSIDASVPDQPYTGSAITIDDYIVIKDPTRLNPDSSGEYILRKEVDYTVSYADNTEIGNATATITGIEHYTGSKAISFNIVIVNVKAVSLDKKEITLTAGDTSTLAATVFPKNATYQTVSWSSGNNSVATVDQNGIVTAVSPGTTSIIVKTMEGEYSDSCSVTVKAADSGSDDDPSDDPSDNPSDDNDNKQGKGSDDPDEDPSNDPDNGSNGADSQNNDPNNPDSDNDNTNGSGSNSQNNDPAGNPDQTPSQTAGSGIIAVNYVKRTSKKLSIKWEAIPGADGYEIFAVYGKAPLPAEPVITTTLHSVVLTRLNGTKLNYKKNIKYIIKAYTAAGSTKTYIAVSQTGSVTGKKTAAYTDIKRIKTKRKSYKLATGKKVSLNAVVIGKNAAKKLTKSDKKLRYLSSDTTVATVTKKGKIRAVKSGTCTIYVTAGNGLTKKVKVTVK